MSSLKDAFRTYRLALLFLATNLALPLAPYFYSCLVWKKNAAANAP